MIYMIRQDHVLKYSTKSIVYLFSTIRDNSLNIKYLYVIIFLAPLLKSTC